jgi:hypothetical protein
MYWSVTDKIYTESGMYSDTLVSSTGCDSIQILDLTITNSSTEMLEKTFCDSMYWPVTDKIYTESGMYSDTLVSSTGCDSIIVLDLTISTIDITITEDNGTLTANPAGGDYKWLDCANNFSSITGETNRSFTPSSSGSYAVEVGQNNCLDTSSCYDITVTTIQADTEFNPKIRAYPNPTNNNIFVNLKDTYNEVSVKVINTLGQLIMQKHFTKTEHFTLTFADKGVFFIKIHTSQGSSTNIKVIKR